MKSTHYDCFTSQNCEPSPKNCNDRRRDTKENRVVFDDINSRLRYEPETGKLFWKDGTRNAGKEAGCMHKASGYCSVTITFPHIGQKRFRAHRLAWLLTYQTWPSDQIDHIDRVRSNNRIDNLRETDNSGNQRNRGLQRNNTSGLTGVYYEQDRGKWRSTIKINGKTHHLGRFETQVEARAARAHREAAEARYLMDREGQLATPSVI